MYNLKRSGEIIIFDERDNAKVKRIPAGIYTLVTLGKVLEGRFHEEKVLLRFDDAEGAIRIENPLQRQIQIDRDTTVPLGHIEFGLTDKGRKLKMKTFLNQFASFNTYIIHCDLIDQVDNLFNRNERDEAPTSSILAVFDIQCSRQTFQKSVLSLRRNREEKNK